MLSTGEIGVQLHDESHTNDIRLDFNIRSLYSPGFDLPHTVQDFLPHIAFGLEFGKCLAGQLFAHLEISSHAEPALLSMDTIVFAGR